MNRTLIVYAAAHTRSNSNKIIQYLINNLEGDFTPLNLTQNMEFEAWKDCHRIVFLAANYGDQELHDLFEEFILRYCDFFEDKICFVGEIGNYYGYDDLEFGAGRILIDYLKTNGASVMEPLFSIDTLPFIDRRMLENWIKYLSHPLKENI